MDSGSRIDRWLAARPGATRALRWAAPTAVLAVAAGTRLWNLGDPATLVFDETYYVKDAWSLWNLGYEGAWPEDANAAWARGEPNGFTESAAFVVHPPLGKWIIGLGMALVGAEHPVGWRIATAIAGILLVALIMGVAWLLTRSVAVATIAGGLLAIDGNAIVMSRVALLDGILAVFVLAGFAFVLLDRAWAARRLRLWAAARADAGRGIDWGPALWWRPWLIAAGAALGAASAVKWSGLYFLAFFAVYSVLADAFDRRRVGVTLWFSGTVFRQAPASLLLTVPVAAAVHLATWTGWFTTDGGYDRQWAAGPDRAWTGALAWVPHALQSLWHYQVSVYGYHVGETRPHGYQAWAITWPLLARPTGMYYSETAGPVGGCSAEVCASTITGLANPIIWWGAVIAAIALIVLFIRRRDRAAGAVLAGVAAGWLPWLLYPERTVFQFYTIAFEPFLVLALALVLGRLLGTAADEHWRRVGGIRLVAVFLGFSLLVSAFFWPLWTGSPVPVEFTRLHYWLPGWR